MSDAAGLTRRQHMLKRLFDLCVALPLLVVTAPLIIVGAVVARVETGRSGIYRQLRVGRDGQLFEVRKIRTMRVVEDVSTTVTTQHDVRITRSGAWMRKWKIDELPQLLNVVRGEMSLVGPRPDVPGFADRLTGHDRVILTVRPGITGPATLAFRDEEQVLASVLDPETHNLTILWPEKVRMNCEYVASWSLLGDVRYVVDTVRRTKPRSPGRRTPSEA